MAMNGMEQPSSHVAPVGRREVKRMQQHSSLGRRPPFRPRAGRRRRASPPRAVPAWLPCWGPPHAAMAARRAVPAWLPCWGPPHAAMAARRAVVFLFACSPAAGVGRRLLVPSPSGRLARGLLVPSSSSPTRRPPASSWPRQGFGVGGTGQ
jgi:hypothetical protein